MRERERNRDREREEEREREGGRLSARARELENLQEIERGRDK